MIEKWIFSYHVLLSYVKNESKEEYVTIKIHVLLMAIITEMYFSARYSIISFVYLVF